MWEPRRFTTLWAFTACYRDSFTFLHYIIIIPKCPYTDKMVARKHNQDSQWLSFQIKHSYNSRKSSNRVYSLTQICLLSRIRLSGLFSLRINSESLVWLDCLAGRPALRKAIFLYRSTWHTKCSSGLNLYAPYTTRLLWPANSYIFSNVVLMFWRPVSNV
jgi:hypothetical protein